MKIKLFHAVENITENLMLENAKNKDDANSDNFGHFR